ncbi:transposase [Streptomyces smyrnaeus]|uniref:Transposase n=1 Tax=Streptomyces smyrnaeus TaxID=1387713 RepID=A0ABS3XUZ3_9ACTN|nr:transposase [Streptomyces smyrnaeus]
MRWRDLPERFGPGRTVDERHRLWPADGTRERPLQQFRAEADVARGRSTGDISAGSTTVRTHQNPAGARTDPPPAPASKWGNATVQHQGETAWQSLLTRLVEAAREVRGPGPLAGWIDHQARPEHGRTLPPAVPDRHPGTAAGPHTARAPAGEDAPPADRAGHTAHET